MGSIHCVGLAVVRYVSAMYPSPLFAMTAWCFLTVVVSSLSFAMSGWCILAVVCYVRVVYPRCRLLRRRCVSLTVVRYNSVVFPHCRLLHQHAVSLAVVPYVHLVPSSLSVGLFKRLGLVDGQWDGMSEEIGKTNHDFHRGSFSITHCMGLPISGSPLIFPSPNPPIKYEPAHIPLERGGAGVAAFCSADPGCW